MKKIIVVIALFLLFFEDTPVFAGFLDAESKNSNQPGIMVGQVCSFVDYPVQQDFLKVFEDVLKEQIQGIKMFVLQMPSRDQTVSLDGKRVTLDVVLNHIHMNAIAKGHGFDREQVSAALLRYADELYGYKYSPEIIKEKSDKNIECYSLSPYLNNVLQDIKEKQQIRYLLFCNVKQVDARNSINGLWHKMDVNIDYYLVDTNDNRVYERNSFSDKSVQKIEIPIYFKYSKTSSPNQMLHDVLEQQAKRIVKDISINGINALRHTKKL